MTVEKTRLPGVVAITPQRYRDERGAFEELWRAEGYAEAAGLPERFVQDNLSRSRPGVLRGLHYQWPAPQGKLVSVVAGRAFDVAVDLRRGAETFGRWVGVELSAETGRQLYVPEGFAHGFVALGAETATVLYKCTAYYAPEAEHTLRWDDPAVGVEWPVPSGVEDAPILSAKDAAAPTLAETPDTALPSV